jgi:hypothetical protein
MLDYSGTCETILLNFSYLNINFNADTAYFHNHIKLINTPCAQYAEYFVIVVSRVKH